MAATTTAISNSSVKAHWLTTATGATAAITVTGSRLMDFAVNMNSLASIVINVEAQYGVLEVSDPNDPDWVIVAQILSADALQAKTVQVAGARQMRLNCTAHAATGTIAAELTAGNRVGA